jgi:predicted MPP superfamily phosphohydrolase
MWGVTKSNLQAVDVAEDPVHDVARPTDTGSALVHLTLATIAQQDTLAPLERRLGPHHVRQRLAVERDHEAQIFGQGLNFFHIENSYLSRAIIRAVLKVAGLYARGVRNAAKVVVRHNHINSPHLPEAFEGFTLLQLSDLHIDMSEAAIARVIDLLGELRYDACVLTGDYRGETHGPYDATLAGMTRLCAALKGPIYGVLGNHDTIRLVPGLEAIGIRMLFNESETFERREQRLHLGGIDDAHFYRMENIAKVAGAIPSDEFSILISHTPEVYREAADAKFDVMLSGHTHGGQICLPGGIPITLDSALPRRMGSGPWQYRDLVGYTSVGTGSSVVPVRFNCPPEIVLHHLHALPPLSEARHGSST